MAGDDDHEEGLDTSFLDDDFLGGASVHELSFEERHRLAERAARRRRADHEAQERAGVERMRARAQRRRGRWVMLTAMLVLGALVGASVGVRALREPDLAPVETVNDDLIATLTSPFDHVPRPPADPGTEPLGVVPDVTDPGGGYGFLQTQPLDPSTPVRWDPCRPIHYVINDTAATPRLVELTHDAIDTVSTATGLQFVDDGTTTEGPSRTRSAYQPGRYGERWAPLLVTWTDAEHDPNLTAGVLGISGSLAYGPDGDASDHVYVTGQVSLDVEDINTIMKGPRGPQLVRSVVEHEFGHIVGLDHTDDESQLLYPALLGDTTSFGAGDLYGLAELGRGQCFPGV